MEAGVRRPQLYHYGFSYCEHVIVGTFERHVASLVLVFIILKKKRVWFDDLRGLFLIQNSWFDFQEFGP